MNQDSSKMSNVTLLDGKDQAKIVFCLQFVATS